MKEKVNLYPGVSTRQTQTVALLTRGGFTVPDQSEQSRFGDANQIQTIDCQRSVQR